MADPRAVGRLPDGTVYFAPLGEMVYDGEDRVQCHLCGRFMRKVGGPHLLVGHGWSLAQYREAFHLREHVPTCSRALSERSRASASSRVGRNGFAEPPADSRRTGRPTPLWRSLAELRPDLASEMHPTRNGAVNPEAVALASHRKLWWRCGACGHEWQATVTNRTEHGSGCPVCSLTRRAATQSRVNAERSLAVAQPDIAAELHPTCNGDLDPHTVGASSDRTLWWLCSECGHEWQARVANRTRGAGCPACWQRRRTRR